MEARPRADGPAGMGPRSRRATTTWPAAPGWLLAVRSPPPPAGDDEDGRARIPAPPTGRRPPTSGGRAPRAIVIRGGSSTTSTVPRSRARATSRRASADRPGMGMPRRSRSIPSSRAATTAEPALPRSGHQGQPLQLDSKLVRRRRNPSDGNPTAAAQAPAPPAPVAAAARARASETPPAREPMTRVLPRRTPPSSSAPRVPGSSRTRVSAVATGRP